MRNGFNIQKDIGSLWKERQKVYTLLTRRENVVHLYYKKEAMLWKKKQYRGFG